MKPVYYMQTDPKWKSISYTIDGDVKETIGASGCGPTSMSMILSTWVDSKITPVDTCKMAIEMKDRTANNGTEWEYFKHISEKYNLGFEQTGSTDKAIEALKQGHFVICSMGVGYFTKGGHYILAYDFDGQNIIVNDPASTIRTKASVELFKKESKQYFIFKKPLSELEKATMKFKEHGITANPEYWNENAQKGKLCKGEYVQTLIINMAKEMK